MKNIFEEPSKYIEKLQKIQLIDVKKDIEFPAKSIAVIFLTRYCNLNCEFCIYKSPLKQKETSREDEIDGMGIEKCIEFINRSNIGYLLISGGGEPFLRTEQVLNLIEQVNVKDIVIVSNGFWANNYERALEILTKIKEIQNKHQKRIIIRISIDKWHFENLGENHIQNIINIYSEFFNNDKELKLKFHTILSDNTIFDILKKNKYIYNIKYQKEYSSDNPILNNLIDKEFF